MSFVSAKTADKTDTALSLALALPLSTVPSITATVCSGISINIRIHLRKAFSNSALSTISKNSYTLDFPGALKKLYTQ